MWVAASVRAAGRASAWNIPRLPLDPSQAEVSSLEGKGGVGLSFPGPPGKEWDLSTRSGAAGRHLLPFPRADLTDLSSLQIFRRADKNGEFPSQAVPEEDLALSILMLQGEGMESKGSRVWTTLNQKVKSAGL